MDFKRKQILIEKQFNSGNFGVQKRTCLEVGRAGGPAPLCIVLKTKSSHISQSETFHEDEQKRQSSFQFKGTEHLWRCQRPVFLLGISQQIIQPQHKQLATTS